MAISARNSSNRITRVSRSIRGRSSRKAAVPMARQKDIPAGKYRSRIEKISIMKTMAGDDAVEVIYELTAPTGSVIKMREILPLDSWSFQLFSDAMIAAGLSDGSDVADAVGVTEDVLLIYPDPHGLGHFSQRTPVTAKSAPSAPVNDADVDDPPSDFLRDWEDDEEDDLV